MGGAMKGPLFLASVAVLGAVGSAAISLSIDFPDSASLTTVFWMSGFVLLSLNVSYFVVTLVVWALTSDTQLPEAALITLPPTAIVYVVRNEPVKVVLGSLAYSLENNLVDHLDAWVLSNSDLDEYLAAEEGVIAKLRAQFGGRRVGYFRASHNPLRRKHVCVDEWLVEHPEYQYVLICDADSRLPSGSVWRLVAKAEHPDNADVVLLQSHISVAEQPTPFVRILALTQDICQQLYASVHQRVFNRGVSYGSGHLVRASEFAKLQVPAWVLSHDIWDTVSLEEKGGRVVFCGDVRTLGSFPVNYIEYLGRSRRWILGTLESVRFCATRQIPLGTRFMTLYPTYMYLFQPLFVLWIAAGVLCDEQPWRPLLLAQKYAVLGASAVDLEMGSHLVLTLTIALAPRVLRCTTIGSAARVFGDVVTSMLLCLTSILFDSLAVLEFLVAGKKGREWVSMKKGDPEQLQLRVVVGKLWPATAVGVAGLAGGLRYAPRWTLVAAPFFCAFLLSIPLAYCTGRRNRNNTSVARIA
jgi:membrane glycosyltransferase